MFRLRVLNDISTTNRKFYSAGSTQIAVRTNSVLTWVLSDHLGSASVTADEGGTKLNETRYTAFGEVREGFSSLETGYEYTGQLSQMEQIGLYYYVARWYDPVTAHFGSADTIIPEAGKAASFDRYAYINNNPVNGTDSTGHCIDGLTTVPCLVALIAITGFAGGAANYEFNVSGKSWWESKDDALATLKAGVDGAILAVGAALTAGQAALMAPEVAMYFGSKTGNASIYSWGATQNGSLPSSATNPNVSRYTRTEFQGRTVYQRNDIDWDFVDPETGLTNAERAQKGWSPIGPDGERLNLHHLLQQEPGPMAEVPATVHRNGQKILHGLIEPGQSFRNNPALNRQYNQFRTEYWKWRAIER